MPKQQWEIDAKDRFVTFLLERQGQRYVVTGEDVVVNPLTGQNYDYALTPDSRELPSIALEIFRLVGEENDIGEHRAWTDVIARLRSELKLRGIAGYLIRTPRFRVPKVKRKQFVSELADQLAQAIAKNPDQEELIVDSYTLRKMAGYPGVEFSWIGGARAVNPFGSVSAAIDNLLPTKNEQLNVQGRLRALLIVNAGMFNEERDVRYYFSTKDFEDYPNVDSVFFENAPGRLSCVFDRRTFECYRDVKLPQGEEQAELLFHFVEHRLLSRDTKAFGVVRMIQETYGNLDRLSADAKDALITCGEKFVEEAEWPSVLWIVEQLKNDPDPPFPNAMHEQIKQGKDWRSITSVRGRLCWLIQKVAVHNLIEHYSSMLNILEEYAVGQDLYVRSQSCVPLTEMAVRRRSLLPDGSRFMPEEIAERIKRIAFGLLQDSGDNPALLADVSSILRWIGDLSPADAAEVVERLSGVEELNSVHARCSLLLYFALSRESQFPDLPHFDATVFKDRLHHELKDNASKFRTSLMWQMAGGAEDETSPYGLILPYLKSFLAGGYGAGFLHLRRICEFHIEAHSIDICPMVAEAFEKVIEYISAEPDSKRWKMYEAWEFFDLLVGNCNENAVLNAVALLLDQHANLPDVSGRHLGNIMARYDSPRARDLVQQHREVLNT